MPSAWVTLDILCERSNKIVNYVNIENENFQNRDMEFTNVIEMKT